MTPIYDDGKYLLAAMKISRIILGVLSSWLMLAGNVHADWKADFVVALTLLEAGAFPSELAVKPADASEIAVAEMQSRIADFNESVPAIFGLWLREEKRPFIELAWWKKRDNDRVGRAFVVALYYCAQVEPVAWLPSFDAHFDRFVDAEKTQRSEEFAFVMEHRSAIAERLAQALEKSAHSNVPDVKRLAERYRRTAEKRLGDPLR